MSISKWWRWVAAILLLGISLPAKSDSNAKPADPAPKDAPAVAPVAGYQTLSIEGWTIHVNDKLFAEHKATTDKTIELLTGRLKEIVRVVPADAVGHLRKVPLWFNPEYPKIPPRAEYHPNADWLKEHGRDPAMAKCVEFTNVRVFEAELKRMPCLVLHELSHAYHDQVLGFDRPDIIAAYDRAVASKSYDAVERYHGVDGRPNTIERAYAMTNHKEYFAETSEAFFGRNDFFPFTRDELEKHDPEMFKVLEKVWNLQK